MTEKDIDPRRIPDIYTQLGTLAGLIEALRLQVLEATDRMDRRPCAVHVEKLAKLDERVERLESGPARPKTPSTLVPPVTVRDLEDTKRQVIAQLDDSVESRVVAALRAEREEEARQLEQKRAADAQALAATLASKAEADKQRWARVQWAAGLIATLLGSGTVVSWCQMSGRLDADRAAVVKALREQPQPVVKVVKMPVPVPATEPAKEE